MESGPSSIASVKQSRICPAFDKERQLIADEDIDCFPPSDWSAEREQLQTYLRDEDLERMHKQLWYAGRKGNISPLHHQKVLHREIILTEKPRLHLVWFDKVIYVQRLRPELLNWRYFAEIACTGLESYQAATGFLLSYTRLLEFPSDLRVAKTVGLVDESITWSAWQKLRADLLHPLADRKVHDRYEYGELRLNRLNQIYRLKCLGFVYFTHYRDYASYFGDNYMVLVALFALVSVALSAAQVLASFDNVADELAVTIYRFSIATLVALASCCTVLLVLWGVMYVWNWILVGVRRDRGRKLRAGLQ